MADLSDVYRSLPDHERAAYRVLALVEPVMNRTQLQGVLTQAGVRNGRGRQLSPGEIREYLDRWRPLGLVEFEEEWQYVRCPSAGGHLAMLDDSGTPMADLERLVGERRDRYSFGRMSDGQLMARLRLALYRGDEPMLRETITRYEYNREFFDDSGAVWELALGPAPCAERIALVPSGFLVEAISQCVWSAVMDLLPCNAAWGGRLDELAAARAPEMAAWMAMSHLLGGRLDEARALVARYGGSDSLAVGAAVDLFDGKLAEAHRLALQAAEQSRGPKGRRQPLLRGPGAPWATLTLLFGETGGVSTGMALARRGLKQKRGGEFPLCYELLDYLANQLANCNSAEPLTQQSTRLDLAWSLMLSSYVGAWGLKGYGVSSAGKRVLTDMAKACRESDYGLLADELERATTQGTRSSSAQSPLFALRTRKPDWEQVLETLERAGAELSDDRARSAGSTEATSRLIWEVQLRPSGALDIGVREQKRRGSGWTSGRPVPESKLGALAGTRAASDHDRRVATHLRQTSYREFGRKRTGYGWEPAVALALVGHGHVYDADTKEHLEVVSGSPELALTRNDGRLTLALAPAGIDKAGVFCSREPGRIVTHEVSESAALVARALRKTASIPVEHEDRLRQAVSSLAAGFRVSSDLALESGNMRSVTAEARVHILCWRAQPGLRLRAVVKPFGEKGPALTPGHGSRIVAAEVDGEPMQTSRDLETESANIEALLEACPTLAVAETVGRDSRLRELVDCYELLTELTTLGDSVVVEWPEGQPLTLVGERDVKDLRVRFKSADDWLRAEVELDIDEKRVAQLREVLKLLGSAQGRFIELEGDRILALTENVKSKLEKLERLGTCRAKHLDVPALAAPTLDALLDDVTQVEDRQQLDRRLKLFDEARDLRADAPADLRASFRDYQLEGYRWMSRLLHWGGGPLLCDDMGLGKTVQILALLLDQSRKGPVLVVAPTSVCSHWEEQARRFAPSLRVRRFREGDRAKTLASLGPGDLLLSSYGLLQRESELLTSCEFAAAVLDEAQAIKNSTSQRARAAHGIVARTRIVSTGTPIENHLGELWSLFHFANPGLLGSSKQFDSRFARPIGERGDRRAMEVLKQLTRPFMLRRTKAEVLDELPEKTEITLRIDLGREEAALYEACRREAAKTVEETAEPGKKRMILLTMLTRLRQAACHPKLLDERHGNASAKHEALFSLVDELRSGGHRALVFSQFVQHLRLVREELDRRGVTYQYLDGSTPPRKRDEVVRRFQQGEGDLFLISLRAGGSGLNLTAADYVIHLDPWWNPAVETQASDRAHRIGQQRPVTVYRLVSAGTVEERILAMHGEKRATAEQLLDGAKGATPMDLDAMRELIGGA